MSGSPKLIRSNGEDLRVPQVSQLLRDLGITAIADAR